LKEKFKGIVTEIANSANTLGVSTDQVTSFDVKILILQESYKHLIPTDNPNFYPFRPGMSANVDIETHIEKDVLSIPIQAVTTREDTSQLADSLKTFDNKFEEEMMEVVFVYKVKLRKVVSSIQDNNYIRIDSGLTADEEVVVSPYNAISKKLKDESVVEKVDKEKLFTDEDE
jgi:HlyD family secretion protein